ncbi:hypothetical protein BDQ94DRAFT_140393 [Aspergillus welwitschiae]|uniref:Uncharacterized protein n=1 Tax=Aspergillus welwitschiae TaxID=1341132 RepID=A0A3F3Q7R9_9EURO|nr:hypothetical protein BDQ94DRAFT_140393 [Aspergillus welwitschiae]RDH35203.1 hypothetical protein BDQ94DRAFT_140393 [Aspergillus welwitschiae]
MQLGQQLAGQAIRRASTHPHPHEQPHTDAHWIYGDQQGVYVCVSVLFAEETRDKLEDRGWVAVSCSA